MTGSDPESQKSGTAEKIHLQEFGETGNPSSPVNRWGEMCAGGNTQAEKIVELRSGGEIGRPFGPPLPRSAD